MKSILGALALLATASANVPAQAASTVTVSVMVFAPLPCTLNGSKPIEVNFGDEVMTTRIDGSSYRQPVDYVLSCNGPANNASGLDAAAMSTSVPDLAVMDIL